MISSPFAYFTDAVLRGPTIGCMLMCAAAAIVGVIVFLRKQSLLGESLSHAAYPGVVLGVCFAGIFQIDEENESLLALIIMVGASATAFAGLWTISFLEKHMKVKSDSALCFVLSVFFGVGLTLASRVQFTYTSLYRQIQVYLYGQAATMTDVHVLIYGILTCVVVGVVILFYKELYLLAFDRSYAKSLGVNSRAIDMLVFLLIVAAVVISIRSVGVVLMSAMLIAPAAAARQYSNKLYVVFILAAFFGLLSGFLGNYLSVEISKIYSTQEDFQRVTLATGPMIVVTASILCLLSLLLAPERGLLIRFTRITLFRYRCACENLLKAIWRVGQERTVSFDQISKFQSASTLYLRFILWRLQLQGWIKKTSEGYKLSPIGHQWATRIVRLHRLWEVYLVDYLGVGAERVHKSAEEMEHIISPELEKELEFLLNNPKYDPHHQPIPDRTRL